MTRADLDAQRAQVALKEMTTDEAREYIDQFASNNFSDTTFHFYIRKTLAGDFSWQLARAIKKLEHRLWCAEVNEDGAREYVAELLGIQRQAAAQTWKCLSCGATSAGNCIASGCAACEQDEPATAPASLASSAHLDAQQALWRPTEQQFNDWCERHDMKPHLDHCAFDDASSLHLEAALASQAPAVQQEPFAYVIVDKDSNPEFVTSTMDEAQAHINDAISEHDIDGAGKWRTVPAHAMRPGDDELWDQTIRDRDTYHDWADKLSDSIAKHFNVDIGEHSNLNLPWSEALDAIEAAPSPQGDDEDASLDYRSIQNAIDIAEKKWDQSADVHNQWEVLGLDEKYKLISEVIDAARKAK